ncbi:MAG: efflux RND transporter permease subunit, partial [Desulfobacterales bacterium]
FWGEGFDHYTLRRVAAEVENIVKRENNVSTTTLIGGVRRQIQVRFDPVRLAASDLDLEQVEMMVTSANQASNAGTYPSIDGQVLVHTGSFLKTVEDVKRVVVGVHGGKPVYLRDVADVVDGPEEPEQYVFFGTGPANAEKEISGQNAPKGGHPAVTLSIAKRKGANAVTVAQKVLERMNKAVGSVIPDNIHITVTRNYGDTAKEKSNELLFHMMIAIVSVTILIWFALGHRESGVVALAIPVTLALTMAVFYLYGYTLNRITLFALIFSIGILVDDAIVVVENIVRHFHLPQNHNRSRATVAIEAVDEVGNPTILATLTVIAAILPMAFVGGLMGPYMRPIPVGATAAMVFSILVAFIVTPWASLRLIKHKETESSQGHEAEDWSIRLYRRIMTPLIETRFWRWIFLIAVVMLLLVSCAMVGIGWVRVKMLPFDNKSEFQVVLDMPEAATLEETSAAAMEMGDYLKTVNEVTDYQIYVGTYAPLNFNGLVRHYYLRRAPHVADIQVNLAEKGHRKE